MQIRQRIAGFILRRIDLLATLDPGADIDADLARLAEHYRDCRGLRPGLAAPIRRR